ncbi:hypothetical protein D3C73_1532410 [compost metagenome]
MVKNDPISHRATIRKGRNKTMPSRLYLINAAFFRSARKAVFPKKRLFTYRS